MDPQVAEAMARFVEHLGEVPAVAPGDWKAQRQATNQQYAALAALGPAVPVEVRRTDVMVVADDGGQLAARWYTREGHRPGASVVYAHGGGMLAGDLDHYEHLVAEYVQRSGVPLLSVNYRLAPEASGARPAQDVLAAVRWVTAQGDALGVDPARIAVMGDSAGGGIAASAAILARDQGVALAQQILIYPMLDDRVTTASPALEPFLVWTPDQNMTGWCARVGGEAPVSAATAPARLEDFRGLAPAYVEVGALDLFRDEVLAFAQRLAAADVPIELHVHPSAPHGYDLIAPDADVAHRAMADRTRVLRAL